MGAGAGPGRTNSERCLIVGLGQREPLGGSITSSLNRAELALRWSGRGGGSLLQQSSQPGPQDLSSRTLGPGHGPLWEINPGSQLRLQL